MLFKHPSFNKFEIIEKPCISKSGISDVEFQLLVWWLLWLLPLQKVAFSFWVCTKFFFWCHFIVVLFCFVFFLKFGFMVAILKIDKVFARYCTTHEVRLLKLFICRQKRYDVPMHANHIIYVQWFINHYCHSLLHKILNDHSYVDSLKWLCCEKIPP